MSAANTVSIKLEVTGTAETISQLKSIMTNLQGMGTAAKQAQAATSGQFGIGPLRQLDAAVGAVTAKVTTFKDRLKQIGTGLQQNGAAFGVATASIWGVYNAYDSLAKVEIRAHQAATRVMTTQTSLAAMENRLAEARQKGNLTAEEMAILEEKITNTKARLAVAQERSADLQGDVNEAWGAFASQVGPQVVAAAGSIAQLVTNLRGSMTGLVPAIKTFATSIGSSITNLFSLRVNAAASVGPVGAIGPAAMLSAGGVRVLSASIKSLLIGTGIGALVVGIGFVIDALGLLNTATAKTADETSANFEQAGQAPSKYVSGVEADLAKLDQVIKKHNDDISKSLEGQTAAYVKNLLEQTKADRDREAAIVTKTQGHLNALEAERQALIKEGETTSIAVKMWTHYDERVAANKAQILSMKAAHDGAAGAVTTLNGKIDEGTNALATLTNQEAAAAKNNDIFAKGLGVTTQEWQNLINGVKTGVNAFIQQNQSLAGTENGLAIVTLKSKEWLELNFKNSKLAPVAADLMNAAIEKLFPNQEKEAKTLEKEIKLSEDLAKKVTELEAKYGVDLPNALITTQDQLEAIQVTLDENKAKMDAFNESAKILEDISGLEKAFKLKVDVEKDVKEFLKNLPKGTRKDMEMRINFKSNFAEVKEIFGILAPAIFDKSTKGGVLDFVINPKLANKKDLEGIADSMIQTLEDHFKKGKGGKRDPMVQKIIDDLKSADTKEELAAAVETAFKAFGLLVDEGIQNHDYTAAGEKVATDVFGGFKTKWGTFSMEDLGGHGFGAAILGVGPSEGTTTFDKNGNPINTPNKGADSQAMIDDQTAIQVALQKTQTAFANLSNEGIKSMAALAKGSSVAVNGIKNNFKVGEVASQKIQTGLANLSNQGIRSLAALASGSSKAMQGVRNNFSVGEVAAQKLQTGLANLSNQGSRSLMALAAASSKAMNGLINNVKAGQKAVASLQSEINALKNKTVTLTTIRKTKNVAGQHGFHGVITSPTNFTVGEGFKPEVVTVTPLTDPNTSSREITLPPVTMSETITHMRNKPTSGPTIIHLEVPVYMGNELLRKYVKEIPLADTGMFPTA